MLILCKFCYQQMLILKKYNPITHLILITDNSLYYRLKPQ